MNFLTHPGLALRERTRAASFGILPRYVHIILVLTGVIVLIVLGWVLSLRQLGRESDLFAEYSEITPGGTRSAVLEHHFSCNQSPLDGGSEICGHYPGAGPFSFIAVTLSNNVVQRVNFSVRAGAMTVGDLVFGWGLPDARLYRQSAIFEWQSSGISATGWSESQRFSYRIPIWNVTFVASTLPILPTA